MTSGTCQIEMFYSNSYPLEAVNYYCKYLSIVSYYTKAILTLLMSEFWQSETLAKYILHLEKHKNLIQ